MQYSQLLANSLLVRSNPVCREPEEVRKQYRKALRRYVRIGGWEKRKYMVSQLKAYDKLLNGDTEEEKPGEDVNPAAARTKIADYKIYLFIDLLQVTGLDSEIIQSAEMEKVLKQFYSDFSCTKDEKAVIERILRAVDPQNERKRSFSRTLLTEQERSYIDLMQENIRFLKRRPYRVLVTATMSAGKSTFINALAGKYISLAQNMACTSKMHTIVGKPFEDGCTYEYDHDLVLTAGRGELLEDNEENAGEITVSTYFNGSLGGERIIIRDSPGVNFSGEPEHREITNRMIRGRKYDLLIFLMNATQLRTVDEAEHLEYVRRHIGRTPILFVVNKVDGFNPDEGEDVGEIMETLEEYLKAQGFRNPQICPVSSHAAWLSKSAENSELSRIDRRMLYQYVDKFEEMGLPGYYSKHFPGTRVRDSESEEARLLKTCGFAYVEQLIRRYAREF